MAITLNGVALANATDPLLFQTCRFPIVDLRRYRQPDEVLQNMPTYIGSWGNGTIAPAISSQVIDVDTVTNVANSCRFPIVSVALTGCSWVAPSQEQVALETEEINWAELVDAYCTVANISNPITLGSVFNADGTLNAGNPYSLNIFRFATAILRETLALLFTHSAMRGDAANTNQFDGLYTQIDWGWQDGTTACDETLNVGNVVDWNALTGGGGTASPDATTDAGTITLWGQEFDVPAGLTLGDFLAWYAESAQANFGRGNEVEWEMHVPTGWRMAVLKALSCITLCNINNFMSNELIARYERLIGGRIAELFGWGLTFPLFETGHVETNTLRFGPRQVGGVPTYGVVFKNIAEVLRMLSPIGEALYGSGQGPIPGDTEPLLGMTRQKIANRFESLSLHWDFTKITAICVRASALLKAGVLATDRHMWLKITNVGVSNFRIAPPDDLTVNTVPLNNAAPAVPSLTAPADGASATDTTPTYTWGAVTGALSYDIQVATDEDFTDVVRASNVTAATYTPAALPLDTYYWRVRSRDLDGASAWSAVRDHTITA